MLLFFPFCTIKPREKKEKKKERKKKKKKKASSHLGQAGAIVAVSVHLSEPGSNFS